jgi:hypothetical protein
VLPINLFARLAGLVFVLAVLALFSDAFFPGSRGVTLFSFGFMLCVLLLAAEGVNRLVHFVVRGDRQSPPQTPELPHEVKREWAVFVVRGADRKTGKPREVRVRAICKADAELYANDQGIVVSEAMIVC